MSTSALRTDQTGQIIPRSQQQQSLATMLSDPKIVREIGRALPSHIPPDRMARVVMTALRTVPKLGECTPQSFMSSVMSASQLGLEPNTPLNECWLIPRKNRKRNAMEANLQIGYQGFIQLARRSGQLRSIYAHVVREGDEFQYELGLNPTLRHVPSEDADRETRPILGVYAVAHLKDADPVFTYLPRSQVEARKNRSDAVRAGRGTPWDTDEEAMYQKTAIRAIWKWLPKSPEMATAEAVEVSTDQGRAPTSLLHDEQARALAQAGVFVTPEPEEATDADADADEDGSAESTEAVAGSDDLERYAHELMAEIGRAKDAADLEKVLGRYRHVRGKLKDAKPDIWATVQLSIEERKKELAG